MRKENDRRDRAEQISSIIRQNLKRAILQQGVSQQDVAHEAGMNPASFSQMLNGNKRLMFEDLYAVCDVLGLSVADLMDATVLQNEMQQKVEALLRQANQLTDQADNLKRQAGELQQLGNIHEDSDSRQGALVGASSPRYLVSPYNADGSLRLDNKGVVLGAFSGRNGKKSPEHMEKSETMTTIIMRTS